MIDHASLPAKASLRARWRGLIPQLFTFVVLPLTVLLIAIALGSLNLHQAAMRALVGERDGRAARASASSIEAALQQRAGEVQWLAQRVVDGIDPNAVLADVAPTSGVFGTGIAIVDRTGRSLAVSGVFGNSTGSDQGGLRQLQAEAQRIGANPVFWALPSSEGQGPLLIVAVRRADVVAAGAFRPADIAAEAFGQALGTSDTMSAYLVDQGQQLVYHAGLAPTAGHLTSHPGIVEALAGHSGTAFMPGDDGEHVIAYSTIPTLGWALIIEEPWHSVDNPLLRTTQMAPLVLAPIAILSLVALWFGWRQVVQPLQALEAKAAELAWGRYDAIEAPVDGITEVRKLQAELIHLAHKVKGARQSLRSYIGAITAGQENERKRLARELHDDTLQTLIALNQRAQLAQLAADEQAKDSALGEIQTLIEQSVANLRRYTRALRPMYLEDLGLATALSMLVREVEPSEGLALSFSRIGSERRSAAEVELAFYRLAQEALANVVRHAQAARCEMTLVYATDVVSLSVRDDGRGFRVPDNPAEFAAANHFGLLGMHERAELIGAHLTIVSAPGRGTQLTVVWSGTAEGLA